MKDQLVKLTFADQLGSMRDRADRIAALATKLAELVGQPNPVLVRAGELAKFDLGSHMVVELSSLAGTMAREYALRAGEPADVATALYEMELPRSAGDELPTTVPGALLSLADRFDLIAGLFATGAKPTGSSDPYGLRRAALGVVSVLRAFPQLAKITIFQGLELAGAQVFASPSALAAASEFIARRHEQFLLDTGYDYRLVGAVMPLTDQPVLVDETLAQLSNLLTNADFTNLIAALARVRRIVPKEVVQDYDLANLREPAELDLRKQLNKLPKGAVKLTEFAAAASDLPEAVDRFFTDVLVMDEDRLLRAARLGLLTEIRDSADRVIDWQALPS